MNIFKRLSALTLTLFVILSLAACGSKEGGSTEDLLKDMKEFTLLNGTASIMLNKSWNDESTDDMDFIMIAGPNMGAEAVFVFQFARDVFSGIDMEQMDEIIKTSYNTGDVKEIDPFEVSNMTNISAYTCTVTYEGETVDACMVYGETDRALYTIGYMANNFNDKLKASFAASLTTFKEAEAQDNTTAEVTDTIRWFNASYAVLTQLNGWDYNRFGGMAANESSAAVTKQLLQEWWEVTDRTTADETLDWLLTEGHRVGFAENMATFEEDGIEGAEDKEAWLLENYEMEASTAKVLAECYDMYKQFGKEAIDGWDYCRALNMMGYYYIAGYYTEQEALDKSLEIAQTVQGLFGSWDELIDSYMRGYYYWSEESAEERQEVYEQLKAKDDNPYAVDFKTPLTKTW